MASSAAATPDAVAAKPQEPDRLEELARQTKRLASERMKFGHEVTREKTELAKQREEFAKQKADFDAWQSARADRKRNPEKYLAQDYGDNWYEELSKYKLNGVPTPGLIASEVDDRVAALKKDIEDRDAKYEQREKDRAQEATLRAEQEYFAGAIRHVETNSDKYPLIHAFGVSGNVVALIQNHFNKTLAENGSGEVLSGEQAATQIEKTLAASVEKASKAKQAKEEAAKPPPVVPSRTPAFQRRTLSNDMTASSAAPSTPPVSDAERMKRAVAAFAAASRSASAH